MKKGALSPTGREVPLLPRKGLTLEEEGFSSLERRKKGLALVAITIFNLLPSRVKGDPPSRKKKSGQFLVFNESGEFYIFLRERGEKKSTFFFLGEREKKERGYSPFTLNVSKVGLPRSDRKRTISWKKGEKRGEGAAGNPARNAGSIASGEGTMEGEGSLDEKDRRGVENVEIRAKGEGFSTKKRHSRASSTSERVNFFLRRRFVSGEPSLTLARRWCGRGGKNSFNAMEGGRKKKEEKDGRTFF